MIVVVGKDGNNKMMAIEYEVMETEQTDSWQWFLKLLLDDLLATKHKVYGFISYQYKELHFFMLCSVMLPYFMFCYVTLLYVI